MELQVLNGITIDDILADHDMPDEVLAAATASLDDLARKVREANIIIKGRLMESMTKENATKLPFKAVDGRQMIATLKSGPTSCDEKDADLKYQNMGFDPLEIGTYVFKPSWTRAKEIRKFGGNKQLIIDELFKPGKPSIEIKEA